MIQRVVLHFELGMTYLAQFIKTRLEYKADFLLGLFTGSMFHVITLIFIDVLFNDQVTSLNGWSRAEVFFIYGFSVLPLNLFFAFFSNLYMVGDQYIIEGQLDRVLLRPLNSLFQILLEKVRIESLFGTVIGVAILYYASTQMRIDWSMGDLLILVGLVFCGLFIYAGVFTALAAVSFWWPDRMGLIPPVYNLIAFGKYPVTIYHPFLQFLLMWIIPFAFVAFFPSTQFLGRESFQHFVILTPLVSVSTLLVGILVWNLGIKRYESTGS